MAQAPIGPGPTAFTVDETGSNGYTVNSDGTLTNFPVSTSCRTKNVDYTTLPTTANAVNLFSPSGGLWAADSMAMSPMCSPVSQPLSSWPFRWRPRPSRWLARISVQERDLRHQPELLPTPAAWPAIVSPTTAPLLWRSRCLEQPNDTVSARIPLGKCPVFALEIHQRHPALRAQPGQTTPSPSSTARTTRWTPARRF